MSQSSEGRVSREFHWTNEDDQEGFIEVSFGPWATEGMGEAPIMISFDNATWMGIETANDFARWFRSAVAEARRKHPYAK